MLQSRETKNSRFRSRRPVIWALIALATGLVIWLTEPAQSKPPIMVPAAERADFVLIEKAERRLTLFRGNQTLRTSTISLGFAPQGDKKREGDGKTPEGQYRIDRRNAQSSFHLSLGINYPRADQRATARAEGRNPGGDIFIHGQPNAMKGLPKITHDWTHGCPAVSNKEIEEIWSLVAIGTKVEIRP